MKDIHFIVPAVPVAQPRARSFNKGPWASRIVSAQRDDPVQAFKATCSLAAAEAYRGPPLEGPLGLSLIFVFPRLTAHKKLHPGRHSYIGKKDVDNICKAVMDSLNKRCWNDDRQITELRAVKVVAAVDEQPHVSVTIWKGSL